MKQVLDLRPVYHRREDRIRAHVILCWLALLLIRVVENTTGRPWAGSAPSSSASTPSPGPAPPAPSARPPTSTKPQRDIYTALGIDPPKKIIALDPAPPTS